MYGDVMLCDMMCVVLSMCCVVYLCFMMVVMITHMSRTLTHALVITIQAINDPSTWLGIIASILLTNVALSDVLGWLTTDEVDAYANAKSNEAPEDLTDAEIDESRYWDLNESAGLAMDEPAGSASAASSTVPPPLPAAAHFKNTTTATATAVPSASSFKTSMASTADLLPVIGVFREHEGPRK